MVTTILKLSRVRVFGSMLTVSLVLSACTAKQSTVQEFGPAPQLSASQMELYSATCASCHESIGSGSPQSGDMPAWDIRWEKGLDGLLQTTVNGLNGMPSLGTCSSCSQKDFQVFIEYMSGRTILATDLGANKANP